MYIASRFNNANNLRFALLTMRKCAVALHRLLAGCAPADDLRNRDGAAHDHRAALRKVASPVSGGGCHQRCQGDQAMPPNGLGFRNSLRRRWSARPRPNGSLKSPNNPDGPLTTRELGCAPSAPDISIWKCRRHCRRQGSASLLSPSSFRTVELKIPRYLENLCRSQTASQKCADLRRLDPRRVLLR